MKYEYKVVSKLETCEGAAGPKFDAPFIDELNRYGKKGWRVVGLTPRGSYILEKERDPGVKRS